MDNTAPNRFIHPLEQRIMIVLVLAAIVSLVVLVLLARQAYKLYRAIYNSLRSKDALIT